MRASRIRQTRVRHLFTRPQRLEEGLKLRLIRVITDIPGVYQLRGQGAPFVLVQGTHLTGVELIIQNTSLTANEVRVEVIRLQAIDHTGHLADSAILEFQDCDAGRVVFVLLKNSVLGFGGMTGNLHYIFVAHQIQQRIHCVATRRKQATTASLLLDVPTILPIPRPYAVIVIHFAVMNLTDKTLINHRLERQEFRGEPNLKADTRLHFGLLHRLGHPIKITLRQSQRLLNNDVFSRFRRRHHLIGVLIRITRDVDHIDVRIGKHILQIHRRFDPPPVPRTEFVIIQQTRGVNMSHLRHAGGVNSVNMGRSRPSVSDNPDVNFFHNIRRLKSGSDGTMIGPESQGCPNR